jgi:pimeloyl-ACP methyl ester carboxylesterase
VSDEAGGLAIDWVDTGEGAVLAFLPGSFSTPAAWRPVQRLVAGRWRMVAASLPGYGGTAESRTASDFAMHHHLRLADGLARRAGGPVHLVAHSFGGAVAVAAALSGVLEVASLSLFEANPLALLRGMHEDLYQDTLHMSREFEAAVARGEPDAAGRIIDFWGGEGAFAAMPEAVKAYCRQTAGSNVLDWRTAFDFELERAQLARLALPVLLVRGAEANPAMVAITEALRTNLPRVRAEVVDGAGHFLITTHAAACAGLLSSFLAGQAPA